MDYPLLLTVQEIIALRLMVRVSIMRHIHSKVEVLFQSCDFYISSPQPKEERDAFASQATGAFKARMTETMDTVLSLDFPLFTAQMQNPKGTSVISLPEKTFRILYDIAKATYIVGPNPSGNEQALHLAIQTNQPAILAAFEVAEDNVKRTPVPTQPPANGAN